MTWVRDFKPSRSGGLSLTEFGQYIKQPVEGKLTIANRDIEQVRLLAGNFDVLQLISQLNAFR
jgi:hypothetical protein